MGPSGSPQQFNISKPGLFNNYDISNPTQPDDAISGTLISGQLNEIKSAIPMPSGLIILTTKNAWSLFGAQSGQAVSAVDVTAQSQAYSGANDVPPIVADKEDFSECKCILNLAWHIGDEIEKYLRSRGFKGELINII